MFQLSRQKSGPVFTWLKQDGSHNHSRFSWSTNLDGFIYEKSHKTFFFCLKWFRLAVHLKTGPEIGWQKTIWKPVTNCVRFIAIGIPDKYGFCMVTVTLSHWINIIYHTAKASTYCHFKLKMLAFSNSVGTRTFHH